MSDHEHSENSTQDTIGNPSLIEVEQLSYSIAKSALLKGLDCKFESAQIHIILGQNGAGKSTLLNCLSHEIEPTMGSIIWDGKNLDSLSYAELALQRAVLSQSNELAFSFSVQALIELGIEVQPRTGEQAQHVIETLLQVCDIAHLRDRDYLTLSGGEQKRTQLARVLAQIWPDNYLLNQKDSSDYQNGLQPFSGKWLFLDEWTAGLDIKHQQSLARYFKQWAKQGLGLIMVLHDISFAAQLADRCLILKDGQIFADGDVSQVLSQTILEKAMQMSVRVTCDAETNRPIITPFLESF